MATLLELRDGAKDLADLADSDFVTDTRWNAWINQGVKRLFGLVATAFAEHFFEEHDFALTSTEDGARLTLRPGATRTFAAAGGDTPGTAGPSSAPSWLLSGDFVDSDVGGILTPALDAPNGAWNIPFRITEVFSANAAAVTPNPNAIGSFTGPAAGTFTIATGQDPPFFLARGVDKDPGTANAFPVRRFNFAERTATTGRTRAMRWSPDITYRVMGSVLIVEPWQRAAGNYRLYYVGRPAVLDDDDDTIPDVLELWSEFVEIFAALKAQGKEETDTGDLGAQLGLIRADIELQASTRDEGEPDTVALVENDDIPYPYRRG